VQVRLEPNGEGLDDRDLPVASPALGLLALEPWRAAVDPVRVAWDVQAPSGQVDVLPGQREQLAEPQPGEQSGRNGALPVGRRGVDHRERLRQRHDGGLAGVAARHLHPEQREGVDVAVDLRGLEAAAQHGDVLADAAGRQRPGDLAGDPGPHLVRVDLGQRIAAEL
jgi:hypothetical protein